MEQMEKKSYLIQMSYEVTDEEKRNAKKALIHLDRLERALNIAKDKLELAYAPFKNKPDVSPEEVFRQRASLRDYRDQVIDSFNDVKKHSFYFYSIMQPFSFDTQTIKIVNSFVMGINDVEKQVNRFASLFSNLDSVDFVKTLVKSIENVKKEVAELEQIINDRIKTHIKDNILASTWVDTLSDQLQEKIDKKIPLVKKLVEDRDDS